MCCWTGQVVVDGRCQRRPTTCPDGAMVAVDGCVPWAVAAEELVAVVSGSRAGERCHERAPAGRVTVVLVVTVGRGGSGDVSWEPDPRVNNLGTCLASALADEIWPIRDQEYGFVYPMVFERDG